MSYKPYKITPITIVAILLFMFMTFFEMSDRTGMFIFDILAYLMIKSIVGVMCLTSIRKYFKKKIPNSIKKTLTACGVAFAVEFVILDNVRLFVASDASIIFFPLCLPVCGFIVTYFYNKECGMKLISKILAYGVSLFLCAIALLVELIPYM